MEGKIKVLIPLFLVLSLLLLGGCSKFSSAQTEMLYEDIEELRTRKITMADDEFLQQLQMRYRNLLPEHREEITNYDLLESAFADLQEHTTCVEAINNRIAALSADLPPEACEEVNTMQKTYSAMEAGNQKFVNAEELQKLYDTVQTWYGEDSLYTELKSLHDQGLYKDAMKLAPEVINPLIPGNVVSYHTKLLADCSIAYLDQLILSGEKSNLIKQFTYGAYVKFPSDRQAAFANKILSAYAQQVTALTEAKDYNNAISLLNSIWSELLKAAPDNSLCEAAGNCFIAQAKALYSKKSYADAISACKSALTHTIDLPQEVDTELVSIYMDATLARTNELIKSQKYKKAYDILRDSSLADMNTAQRQTIQDKIDALFETARPKNGAVIVKGDGLGKGYGKFNITNNGEDAIIRITPFSLDFTDTTNKTASLVYIRGGSKIQLNLADGEYQVEFQHGDDYLDSTVLFLTDGTWERPGYGLSFSSDMSFKTTYSGNSIQYTVNNWEID